MDERKKCIKDEGGFQCANPQVTLIACYAWKEVCLHPEKVRKSRPEMTAFVQP